MEEKRIYYENISPNGEKNKMSFMARMFNRRARINADEVINSLNLKSNEKIADIGSGGGYFSYEFAKRTKKIYALDINEKFLDFVKKQAKKQNFKNVQTIKIKDEITTPEKVDLIFIRNVYHHIKNRIEYFKNLKHFLKGSGRLAIIEWKAGETIKGHSTEKQTIINELKKVGYDLIKDIGIPKQNFLIFRK